MKTVLILYILIINLIGFLMMGIDKGKSIRRKWRIPERTLFLVAFLWGSVGILIGMYLFRHKTRHLSFSIGVPAILVLQLVFLLLLFSWNKERMGSPSQAVQHELELISELDSATIQSYISYKNLTNSYIASGDITEDTAKAVELFFKNFSYNIHRETISGNEASVSVSITNLDMKALAADLCTSILRQSVEVYPESYSFTTSDYYQLLYDTLAEGSYEETVTTATFHLLKEESGWVIQVNAALEDELVSGFISYMNDPYLLSASEVLSIHLDALNHLTADQWISYLSIEDIFATYNTDYYSLIDTEYAAQLAQFFDYEILRCSENGNTASAVVRINSIDMTNVLAIYKKHLLAYAATTKSIRDDDVTFSNKTAELLLLSLQENKESAATDVNLTFHNNGKSWEIFLDSSFTDALMGGMENALAVFNNTVKEPEILVR